MSVAPLITWLFVRMRPFGVSTRPEPAACWPFESVVAMFTTAGLAAVATWPRSMLLPDASVGAWNALELGPSPDPRGERVADELEPDDPSRTATPAAAPAAPARSATTPTSASAAGALRRRGVGEGGIGSDGCRDGQGGGTCGAGGCGTGWVGSAPDRGASVMSDRIDSPSGIPV